MAEPARRLPLIGIPTMEGSEEVVHYFNSFEEADKFLAGDPEAIPQALALAGAWADLDEEDGPDMLDELDRMRHASPPSPPLEI
jgi:hypothetical protein